ncbi:MAG: hypothetical protein PHE50_08420 [Dehalococcoidales bacterium]|nr:hypothetical protein [Dehalococcoidales bacterium]
MKKLLCLLLIMVTSLTACNQSGNTDKSSAAAQTTPVKITLNSEVITLANPALAQKDVVYVTTADLGNLPGIKVVYDPAAGTITATRGENTLNMQIGQPLKAGDKNGPVPFIRQELVYVPFCDTIGRLNYNSSTEKAVDGTLTIVLEKLGFDFEDYLAMVTADKFSEAELKAAETALARGVTIADPQGDWAYVSEGIQGDGRMDNAKPYPIGFTDVTRVTLGADDQYMYVKYVFDAVLPDKLAYYENPELGKTDFISGLGGGFFLSRFFNRNTGKDDVGGMSLSISWVINDDLKYTDNPNLFAIPVVGIQNQATLNGLKYENGDDRYNVDDSNGRGGGGAGTNYILAALPLKEYGLQFGDVVEGSLGIEVGSKLFHHASCDVILDCGYKSGATIRYQIGANTYENLGPPTNMEPKK